ncbi:hypothetical protein D7W79_30730 [Corallococcus exercitus]|nr:hypothetical protein D7W79_30730 [Corallococcus exercitus]
MIAATQGRFPDALALERRCYELHPDSPNCLLASKFIKSRLSYTIQPSTSPSTQSPSSRNSARAPLPKDINEIRQAVNTLNKEGRTGDALKVAQACVDRDPREYECHLMLGVLYAKRGDSQLSEQSYERFLTLAPQDHPKRARVIEILSNASSRTLPTSSSASE